MDQFNLNNTLPLAERVKANTALMYSLPRNEAMYRRVQKKVTEDILLARTIFGKATASLIDIIIAWNNLGFKVSFEKPGYNSYKIELSKVDALHSGPGVSVYVSGDDLQKNAPELIRSVYNKYFKETPIV